MFTRTHYIFFFLFLASVLGCYQPGVDPVECAGEVCMGLCCDEVCTQADELNCGACGLSCGVESSCVDAACICEPNFRDCDGDWSNGCETAGACLCDLGLVVPCYNGPVGTQGIGSCRGGVRTCLGTEWSGCEGEILPQIELCEINAVDEDCDGYVDEREDGDGDGWSRCDGDCCDSLIERCANDPALVNPGAYDFPDNEVDDDCNGIVDDQAISDCSALESTYGVTAQGLVQAMDLCQESTMESGRWGLVSARLHNANGQGMPSSSQVAVLSELGAIVPSSYNQTMAVLSSGEARGVGDPGYSGNLSFSSGSPVVGVPSGYLNAHGGQLATTSECVAGSPSVFDSVLLRLQIRVPTNAHGFEFKFRFFSHEYPVYLCTEFNDFFLALLSSQHPDIPDDYNISFDSGGNPVSINNAFFTSCEPIACNSYMTSGPDNDWDGCVDSLRCNDQTNMCETQYGSCPDGSDDVLAYNPIASDAGATAWLTTSAPVVPGEIIWLDFHIWDTGDSNLDSLVLLDHFEWLIEPTEVITKL